MFRVGEAVKVPCLVLDASKDPATGKDVNYTSYDESNNVVDNNQDTVEVGGGVYECTVTPDKPGTWKVTFQCADPNWHDAKGFLVVGDVFTTTFDLHQAAATYDLATATGTACVIESVVFSPRVDVSDDAAGITAISIQTDTTTSQVIFSSTDGLISYLTAYAQLQWTGSILLPSTKKIQITIVGGTATADPTTCDVTIKYHAAAAGGYLA